MSKPHPKKKVTFNPIVAIGETAPMGSDFRFGDRSEIIRRLIEQERLKIQLKGDAKVPLDNLASSSDKPSHLLTRSGHLVPILK